MVTSHALPTPIIKVPMLVPMIYEDLAKPEWNGRVVIILELVEQYTSFIAKVRSNKNKVETIRSFLVERMYQHNKVREMSANANAVVLFLFNLLLTDQEDGKPGVRGYDAQRKIFANGGHVKFTGDCGIIAPALIAWP